MVDVNIAWFCVLWNERVNYSCKFHLFFAFSWWSPTPKSFSSFLFHFSPTEQLHEYNTQTLWGKQSAKKRIKENQMLRDFYQDVRTLLRFLSEDFSEMSKNENEKIDTVKNSTSHSQINKCKCQFTWKLKHIIN